MLERLAITIALLGCFAAQVVAQEWTRFRGPNGDGNSPLRIPAQWSEGDYRWRIDLPGVGHSSPVVWGSRVFLTSADNSTAERMALCVDLDNGQTLWTRRWATAPHTKHNFNSFASSTPVVDAEGVYVAFTEPEHNWLIALAHNGREIWKRDLGRFASQHSGGTSPIRHDDLVLLGNEQDGASSIVALDAATGEKRWETPRRTDMVSYSTPCLLRRGQAGDQLVFLSSAHGMSALDPATGRVLWESAEFDKRTCSSPIIAGDLVLGSCGSGGGGTYLVAVRPPQSQDQAPQRVYRIDKGAAYVPTAVVRGDRLFIWSDKGIVTCADTATGETLWQRRIGGNFFGSPVCCADKLLAVSESGEAVVLAASDTFAELARNKLDDESRATPAASGGRLLVRTASKLFCVQGQVDPGQ